MNIFDDFAATERDKHLIRPVTTTWALHIATLIDAESPGFLGALLRTKGAKRHVILAVLARSFDDRLSTVTGGVLDDLDVRAAMKALGDVLPTMKPREALSVAFETPAQFEGLGTFARLVEPLKPRDYIELVEVLSNPGERRRQQALQHIPRIDHDRLRAVLALDPALCAVRFARKVRRESQAKIANDVLAVVRMHRPDLSDEDVREFCGQGDQFAPLNAQLERLLGLVKELPPLSFPIPDGFRHLRTFAEFEDCGRRFRNCIASKWLGEAVPQRVVYLEHLPRPAIAALLPTSQGLLLSKVHPPGNAAPTPDLVEEVRAALASSGVGFITPAPVIGPLASVRFALMEYDIFGLGPDEFDASAPELN